MFKLAAFTDEISQDFARAVAVAREFNLHAVEIRSVWNHPPQDIPAGDIERMKPILRDARLRVCCIAAPFFKCELDSDAEYREHLDILRRCIDLAQQFDCSLIRGFTFWRRQSAAQLWNKPLWKAILKKFDEPIRILEQKNATLGIENESSTYIGTGDALARFLKELNSPRVRAVWDPANSFHDEDEPEKPFPDGYQALRPFIVHVHVKDCRRNEQGHCEHAAVGEGQIGWLEQFRQLLADNYTGYVSLETHWRLSKKLAEDMVNRPGGAAYSESAEMASRICLENILKMLPKKA